MRWKSRETFVGAANPQSRVSGKTPRAFYFLPLQHPRMAWWAKLPTKLICSRIKINRITSRKKSNIGKISTPPPLLHPQFWCPCRVILCLNPQPLALSFSHGPSSNYFLPKFAASVIQIGNFLNRLLNNGIKWKEPVSHKFFVLLYSVILCVTWFCFVSNAIIKVWSSIPGRKVRRIMKVRKLGNYANCWNLTNFITFL